MRALDVLGVLRLEDGRLWADAAHEWQLADARAVTAGSTPFHFLTRGRGGSKTTDLAAVALALLVAAEARSRSYWLAADREQGALAIDAAAGFVDRTPALRDALGLTASAVEAPASGARLDVLAADAASSWGLLARRGVRRRAGAVGGHAGVAALVGVREHRSRQARRRAARRADDGGRSGALRAQDP